MRRKRVRCLNGKDAIVKCQDLTPLLNRVHEVEAEDVLLAVRLNVEAIAIVALVFNEAAVADGLPFISTSQRNEGEQNNDCSHCWH